MADIVAVTPGGFTYSTVNLDDPIPWSNHRAALLGYTIAFALLSWLSASGRLYTRFKVLECPGIDDYLVVAYLLTTTTGTVCICLAVEYGGLGQHVLYLTEAQKLWYIKAFYGGRIAYVISSACIKLALLFQYIRIYRRGTWMHQACVATIAFVVAWGSLYLFLALFPCFPVSSFLNKTPHAKCFGYGSREITQYVATYTSHSAVNLLIDVIVIIIPAPLVFNKKTGPAQRWRLVGLIFLGVVVLVLASWRLETIIVHRASTYPTRDTTWYGPITILLANLEVDAAAICASVPVFWPVLTNTWVGRIFVTREVCVTSEERIIPGRYGEADHAGVVSDIESQPGHVSRSGSQSESYGKRSLSAASSRMDGPKSKDLEAHYQDSYILQHLDPLKASGHHAEATSNGPCLKDPGKRRGECSKAGGWVPL